LSDKTLQTQKEEPLSEIMIAFAKGDPSGDFLPEPGEPGYDPRLQEIRQEARTIKQERQT
jgi:hypothetical protein